jgi:general secretion pathway protein G
VLKHLQSREDWNEKSLTAKGFTLVELLVVIVILGILAAVVVFAVSGITDNAEKNACESEIRTVKTAVEAYRAEFPNGTVTQTALENSYLEDAPKYVSVQSGGALQAVGTLPDGCTL